MIATTENNQDNTDVVIDEKVEIAEESRVVTSDDDENLKLISPDSTKNDEVLIRKDSEDENSTAKPYKDN